MFTKLLLEKITKVKINTANKRIPTKHIDINNSILHVCDVVKIDEEIYIIKCDKKLHPVRSNKKIIWRTSHPIEKVGTIEEYPEYLI